jgi:hypothetical protein
MAKFVGLITIGLFGVMLADVWNNPGGVGAATNGAKGLETPLLNAMLGQTS